ncbi:unnamed protein product, partial [Trichobilharzia szidati]
SLDFLGHTIDCQGIRPLATKVEAILNFPEPKTVKCLRTFNGLPLTDLLRGNNKAIELDTSARHAFTQVKKAIADATLLMYQDPTAPLSISVDASDTAIGAVLQQLVNNEWQPLAFFSRRLQVTETK